MLSLLALSVKRLGQKTRPLNGPRERSQANPSPVIITGTATVCVTVATVLSA
jgi:hypothetical protein